ncbi:hypothetical protein BKI52_22745 [marine bacterium AO1-C]|nr:hypothetical protein BKI52_22745 [marine bacterium AO1-C]
MSKETIIYEDVNLVSTYYHDKKYFLNYWTGKELLNDEGFTTSMMGMAKEVHQYDGKGILIDTRKFDFPISPEIQSWYDTEIVPLHVDAGIKKMAFLLPEEFVSKISISQTMQEEQAQSLQKTKYFGSSEEAEEWLLS